MGKLCSFAEQVEEDLYLCRKYNSYCLMEKPDRKQCIEVYGSEYDNNEDKLLDDEENIEEKV